MDQKIHLFYQVIFKAGQFTYQHVDLAHSVAVQAVMLVSSSLGWHYLAAPHAGSCSELLNLPSAPWKLQPLQGESQPFASKKHWEEVTVQQREGTKDR